MTGSGAPAVDDSLAGIPASVKLQCHYGADGVIGKLGRSPSSCHAILPRLGRIPKRNKDLVMTRTDTHGDPHLSSRDGVCAGRPGTADAYEWNFCWKVWDALRGCAYDGKDCGSARWNTRRHRSTDRWSDGVPLAPMAIQDSAPLRR